MMPKEQADALREEVRAWQEKLRDAACTAGLDDEYASVIFELINLMDARPTSRDVAELLERAERAYLISCGWREGIWDRLQVGPASWLPPAAPEGHRSRFRRTTYADRHHALNAQRAIDRAGSHSVPYQRVNARIEGLVANAEQTAMQIGSNVETVLRNGGFAAEVEELQAAGYDTSGTIVARVAGYVDEEFDIDEVVLFVWQHRQYLR